MELIGYSDRPGAASGETLTFHISTDSDHYSVQLVELIQADENPEGPGYKERELDHPVNGKHRGLRQRGFTGSYLVVQDASPLQARSLSFGCYLCATLPAKAGGQAIAGREASGHGWTVRLDDGGRMELRLDGQQALLGAPLRAWEWYFIAASFDADSGVTALVQRPLDPIPRDETALGVTGHGRFTPAPAGTPFLIAAEGQDAQPRGVGGWFNGKIDRPTIVAGAMNVDDLDELGQFVGQVIASWDFSKEMSTDRAVDAGPNCLHGRFINAPGRAMTGHNWTGDEVDFRLVPDQYGAVHFHDSDLADLGWEPSIELVVPEDFPSGVYALRLRADEAEDHIPFFVRPPRGTATASVLYVIPTWTYLAYANERATARLDFNALGITDRQFRPTKLDELLASHPEFGLSMYDLHADGSGVMFSTWRRPIIGIRPKYRWSLSGGPQYLGCDLYVVNWLKHLGQDFDVATDHDVHEEGLDLLRRYRVVITASHPEYLGRRHMDAFRRYTSEGGRLMYLGGNGFYWSTTLDPQRPYLIEVRRGFFGTRSWQSQPGEEHHAMTGERGGLWRLRGRSPNKIVGIGFSAEGWDTHSPGYRRQPASRDSRAAWIFEGIDDELIGHFGLIMNGAASDEIDRYDVSLGSPPHALVLASSGPHSKYYLQVVDDVLFMHANIGGPVNPKVRADLVFFETPGDGAVFSVGSKGWVGSLAYNDYDNNVFRLTTNVLRGFLERSFADGK